MKSVRHRVASSQSGRLLRRQFTPGRVIIEPGSARRVKRTAAVRCPLRRCRARCRRAGRCCGLSPRADRCAAGPGRVVSGYGAWTALGELGERGLEAPGEALDLESVRFSGRSMARVSCSFPVGVHEDHGRPRAQALVTMVRVRPSLDALDDALPLCSAGHCNHQSIAESPVRDPRHLHALGDCASQRPQRLILDEGASGPSPCPRGSRLAARVASSGEQSADTSRGARRYRPLRISRYGGGLVHDGTPPLP